MSVPAGAPETAVAGAPALAGAFVREGAGYTVQVSPAAAVASGDGVTAALWGTPRWTDPELAARARREGEAAVLLAAWQRWGEAVLERLDGAFALAVLEPAAGRALLATDRLGIVPLYHAPAAGGIVFGTRADAVARHPAVAADLDPQGIYDYLHFHVVPGPGTVFRGVRRLLPGHRLRVEHGATDEGPYWVPRFGAAADTHPPATREELFGRLRHAVREAADGADGCGAFLSGGTDSSAVAGLMAALGLGRRAYSIGFEAPGYDELAYARIAARHFGLEHRTHYLTPDEVAAAVPRIAAHFDQPFGNASVVAAWRCAALAREDGVGRLLAGDGGDELFGGNARYARLELLALYGRLPAAVRALLVDPLARPGGRGPLAKLARYVEQARRDPVARAEDYNLLRRLGPERVLEEDFLAAVDPERPLALRQEAFHGALADHDLDRMLAMDLRFTLADDDLQKVGRACELAGVEVAFPLLDREVVAFACALPPRLKATPRRLRVFYRRAMRGFLPRAILRKPKHGFGVPFGLWLGDHEGLRGLALGSLEALADRGIVRRDFLDELTTERVREHPAYYGVMVWVLMMLEQWLSCR